MAHVRLTLAGPSVTLQTADTVEVLRLATAYLDAVRRAAAIVSKGVMPAFDLPIFKDGSVDTITEVRSNPAQARLGQNEVHRSLLEPKAVPPGLRTAVADLREVLLDVPDDCSVKANGLADTIDLTDLVRGVHRPTVNVSETLRVRVIKAGGRPKNASVRLDSPGEGEFTLRASESLAKEAGSILYSNVDIEADLVRAADDPSMPIVRGRLRAIHRLGAGPTLEELRAWYNEAHPLGVSTDD